MGIRFYCPNGHRLNVKDFLAGKRGICPHCEVRFRIPRESEIPKGSPRVKPGSAAEASGAATNGKRRPKKSVAVAESYPKNGSTTGGTNTLVKSEPTDRLAGHDPIAEAPEAVWYVRPPSGGQYGPAKGDIMRRWVVEGRVSADSLVWREGWTDWQLAGPLFPGLGSNSSGAALPSAAQFAGTAPAAGTASAGGSAAAINSTGLVGSAATTTSRQTASLNLQSATNLQSTLSDRSPLPSVTVNDARGPNKKKSVVAVVGLAVLILVLAVVLVIVVVAKT